MENILTQNIGSEQRRHPRTAVGATFDISMQGPSAAKCRATITDLSAGGMTFKTDAELEKGMTLHLRVTDIQIRGEVRSVHGATGGQRRYGVRFHKVGLAPIVN
ncbi:MAG: PilZ domain-containing protein [Elusimicrobiota bacterium]|nr:PilZ domain-containing protein [Elusimicrobiota bacterium]